MQASWDYGREIPISNQRQWPHQPKAEPPITPTMDHLYQQGYDTAVRHCEAEAQKVVAREVDAAITRRNEEVLVQFNIEVENAVACAKAPLSAELNAAN